MMMVFSPLHGLVLLLLLALNLIYIPAVRKAGFSGWWVVLSIVPIVGLVLLWVFAFAQWPAQPER
jgi:hypothetical protein